MRLSVAFFKIYILVENFFTPSFQKFDFGEMAFPSHIQSTFSPFAERFRQATLLIECNVLFSGLRITVSRVVAYFTT